MINGVTELNIMKIDVLSHLPEIKVCTGYSYNDEEKITQVPFDLGEDFQPIYETFKGWRKDISGIKEYINLPKECRYYIEFIERRIKIPITRISVGPDRKQTINK
jgi:adenylosuccinate synthase